MIIDSSKISGADRIIKNLMTIMMKYLFFALSKPSNGLQYSLNTS